MMKNTPYPDERKFEISSFKDILNSHRLRYPSAPNEDWFIRNALVDSVHIAGRSVFTLNRHSKHLQMYASRLCSQLWEDYNAGPSEKMDRLSWWYDRTEFLRPSFDFLNYMSAFPRSNFLDACLIQILDERDLQDWEWEKRKFGAELATMNGRLLLDEEVMSWLPNLNSEEERLYQYENPRLDPSMFVDDARGSYHFLILCLFVGEGIGSGDSLKRECFWKLMQGMPERPFIYRALSMACRESIPELIAHLLSRTQTALIGTLLLSKFTLSESIDSMEILWNEGLAFIGVILKGMNDVNEESRFIVDVIGWLVKQHRTFTHRVTRSGVQLQRQTMQYQSFCELLQVMQRYSNTQESFISAVFPSIFDMVKLALDPIESKLESPYWDIILWLCSKVTYEYPAISDRLYRYLFAAYRNVIRTELAHLSSDTESYVAHEGWIAAGLYMRDRHVSEWASTLSIANGTLIDDPSSVYVRRQKIRIHLRWLAYMARNISDPVVLRDVSDALVQCFRAFQQDDFLEESTVDAFSWMIEANAFQSVPTDVEPLLVVLTDAINRLPADERSRTLEAFAESTTDARRLAVIFNHLANPIDRETIQHRLLRVTSDESSSHHSLSEVQSTISELLATRVPAFVERASSLYNHYEPVGRERCIPGWVEWSYRIRLHLAFAERNFDTVEQTLPPDRISSRENFEVTRQFYKALVHFERGGRHELTQAINDFRHLHSHYPGEYSYLINLVAAYVRYFGQFDESEVIESQSILEAKSFATKLIGRVTEAVTPHNILATVNVLYLFIVLKNWEEYWSTFRSLPELLQQQFSVSLTRLEVLFRKQHWQEAIHLIEEFQVRHESNPELVRYQMQIEEHTNSDVLPGEVTHSPWMWQDIADALARLATLPDPNAKARAYFRSEDFTYERLIQILVLKSCQQVREYAPYLIRNDQIANEDSHILSCFAVDLGGIRNFNLI